MMPTQDNPIKVVYILSNGRSGTTLLDLLLGAHPNVWTLGEAQILPWELKNRRAPCGCGEPIERDDFWQPLLSEIPLETTGYHVGYFRNERQVGKVLRWSHLPGLLRGRVSPDWERAAREYAAKNEKFFRVAHRAAEERLGRTVKWLVDNSKDPYRLFWLQQSPQFDLRVVHLVKDPRAFVYSMVRRDLPGVSRKVIRFTGRWIVENAIMQRLMKVCFLERHTFSLSYERLASDPASALKWIGNGLGLRYSDRLIENFRDYENHAISGNMMRWRDRDDEIRLDDRWRRNLPVPHIWFVSAVTRPFYELCGYPGP